MSTICNDGIPTGNHYAQCHKPILPRQIAYVLSDIYKATFLQNAELLVILVNMCMHIFLQMETRILRSGDRLQYVSLLLDKSRTLSETVKYTRIIECQIFYHCLCLQCHDTLQQQNFEPVTFVEDCTIVIHGQDGMCVWEKQGGKK